MTRRQGRAHQLVQPQSVKKSVAFLCSLEENGKKKGRRGQRHEWGNRRNGVSASVAIKPFKTSWQGNDIELLKDIPIPTFLAVKVPMSTLNGIFLHKFVLPVLWRFTNPLNLSADEGG